MIIQCIEQLIQYFNGERRIFELPLTRTGTAFQKQVWNELAAIPFGKTISYLELAIKTGDPKATRAVANANGKNNIAIIFPVTGLLVPIKTWLVMEEDYGERNGCWNMR